MNTCTKCGYEWEGLKDTPKQCPQCKNYRWNKENRPSGKPITSPPKEPLQKPIRTPTTHDTPQVVVNTTTTPQLTFKERLALRRAAQNTNTKEVLNG